MKSPTSLIRIRNAVGVMLALSAIFAVVISTISLPSDEATAQVADATTDVEARAAAWWNSLTADQRLNVLHGEDFDEDEDSDARIVSPDADATTTTNGEAAVMDYAGQTTLGADGYKAVIDGLVDGSTANVQSVRSSDADASDIYAVGEETVASANAIRGFQSVELWWNHLTCVEARTAVGEDNDALEGNYDHDGDGNTDVILETSAVCEFAADAEPGR